jgi:hypothetical protein
MKMQRVNRLAVVFAAILGLITLAGCTSRGMTVTSNPPGAELSINRRVVGKTPMRVGFTHYGAYRIEMRRKGFETLVKEESIKPGYYGYDPAAFVADNLVPARLNDEVYLHYVMTPLEQARDERTALMDRAMAAREGSVTHQKSGEKIVVDLGREPKKLDSAGSEDLADAPIVAENTAPTTEMQTGGREIGGVKPKGLTIAEDYGITSESDKLGTFDKPTSADKKKPETPRDVRTPKEEELIYEQPEIKDPNAAKAKK